MRRDTASQKKDTLVKKQQPRDIETTIKYYAEDSIVMDAENRTAFLYKDAKVEYGTKNITANTIDMDYKINVVTAVHATDTTGKKLGVPIFKDGADMYEAEQIKYNYKTKRGQVKQIITKQGDGIVHGQVVKKEPDNSMYLEHAQYSTCDLREPHFCIKAMKIKMIPNKKIVTKAFNFQFDDIPTPLAFPFGIFPITKKRASGIIIPSYGENQQRGLMLLDGGFYWATNPYMGMKFTTDFYTNGGNVWKYTLDYRSRYSFQGNFNFQYTDIYLNRDNPLNQGKQNAMRLAWTHSTLTKGTGRLSASVSIFTNNFNQQTQYDIPLRQQGQQQSSVNYSNQIKKTPFSYSLSARQSQNNQGAMDFTLPSGSLVMRQIFPLREVPIINKVEPVKKFSFGISTNFNNQFSNVLTNGRPNYSIEGLSVRSLDPNASDYTTQLARRQADSLAYYRPDSVSFAKLLSNFGDYSKWNINFNPSFGTTVKLFKYFNVNPKFSYNETWFANSYKFSYDNTTKTYDIDTLKNFKGNNSLNRNYNMSTGADVTTRIYGTFYIKKWNLEAIRHTLNPSVGYSYTPDLTHVQMQQLNVEGKTVYFDKFTGAQSGPKLEQQNITFGLNNQFEMKVRDIKDTAKITYKKIMLLDQLSLNGTYNLRLDSFNLSNISLAARTKVKIFDINFTSSFDPYYYQEVQSTVPGANTGYKRTPYLAWHNLFHDGESAQGKAKGFMSMVNANLAIGATFKPKSTTPQKISTTRTGTDNLFFAQSYAPYVDWSLPWTLNVNYIMSYSKYSQAGGFLIERSVFANNVQLNGDISLNTKWKITAGTAFDVNRNQIATTRISVFRDLHCWQASITWTYLPASNTDAFFATIGIKSPSMRDLKFERRSQPF